MSDNFLLQSVQRDSRNTLLLGLVLLGLGLWGWANTQEVPLRCSAVASIISGTFALYLGRHTLRPENEPSLRGLRRFGPVDEVLAEIQQELQAQPSPTWFGKTLLLPNWLVCCGVGVTVVRLDDLAAMHYQQNSIQNWELLLYTFDGRCELIPCRNHTLALGLVALLGTRSLWVEHGPHVPQRWQDERETLLQEIRQRRALLQKFKPESRP